MPYSRVQFTSPQRGEVGLRSKPGEGALHLTIDRNPSPQPSPIGTQRERERTSVAAISHNTQEKRQRRKRPPLFGRPRDHFIGHLSAKRSWLFSTMVATVFSASWPSASFTTSCR